MSTNDHLKIIGEVKEWNQRYVLDRWWRTKHNIPYGSPAHLDTTQVDIAFEYIEDRLFNTLLQRPAQNNNSEWDRVFEAPLSQVQGIDQLKFDDNGNIIGVKL